VKNFNFPEHWKNALGASFCDDFFGNLTPRIDELIDDDVIFFPPIDRLFQALHLTSFLDTKVLILGQDPYHRFGQANGLAFSVNRDVSIPPSLRNIYLELAEDVECSNPNHGDLSFWSQQGVLLLNSSLSVEEGKPNSHQDIGWSILTNKIIDWCHLHNLKTFSFFWMQGRLVFLFKTLFDKSFKKIAYKKLSFKSLTSKERKLTVLVGHLKLEKPVCHGAAITT
jgi:uracil-DNA glycosylase